MMPRVGPILRPSILPHVTFCAAGDDESLSGYSVGWNVPPLIIVWRTIVVSTYYSLSKPV
jgi:hypothetical protein